ncbi:class I SAM-dependent methyltransferase [Oceanicaulis alexandrii]|uniref:class I SAM-dependent methyltransferase n=1 Tax=Oceanicaulis alexandrii TaxID=153233 RepID=UPI0003B6A30C|nr:class I SAM-dependent methyltransferase [Oceanicaulis alexandrii]
MTSTLKTLLRFEGYPALQNKMFDTRQAALNSPTGDIHLVECLQTGLVYNAAFEPDLVVYDQDYENDQGFSPRFEAHLKDVADLVLEQMRGPSFVEIGCGMGRFLQVLRERGGQVRGYDPAYVGDDGDIVSAPFTGQEPLAGSHIVLRHVLEHVPDPVGFLAGMATKADPGTLIYIEVPCFDWICEARAWFDIFYEHVNYFRLSDFHNMFGRVLFADRGFDGQYLRVICDLSTLRVPTYRPDHAVRFPDDFMKGVEEEVSAQQGAQPVIWGGASKGVIYALLCQRAGCAVQRVIDINPAKQGRFLASTGLEVMSAEAGLKDLPAGTEITVMNANYLDEIQSIVGDRFTLRGMFSGSV